MRNIFLFILLSFILIAIYYERNKTILTDKEIFNIFQQIENVQEIGFRKKKKCNGVRREEPIFFPQYIFLKSGKRKKKINFKNILKGKKIFFYEDKAHLIDLIRQELSKDKCFAKELQCLWEYGFYQRSYSFSIEIIDSTHLLVECRDFVLTKENNYNWCKFFFEKEKENWLLKEYEKGICIHGFRGDVIEGKRF